MSGHNAARIPDAVRVAPFLAADKARHVAAAQE